jgi:hypothetical protein
VDSPAELEDDIEEEGEGEEGPDEMEAGNDRTATAENVPVSKSGLLFLCTRAPFP